MWGRCEILGWEQRWESQGKGNVLLIDIYSETQRYVHISYSVFRTPEAKNSRCGKEVTYFDIRSMAMSAVLSVNSEAIAIPISLHDNSNQCFDFDFFDLWFDNSPSAPQLLLR